MSDNFATGTQDGTGASIDINLGWIPDYVVVQNWEATDYGRLEFYKGMTDGHAIKLLTGTDRDLSKITSLGITLLGDAAADTIRGFRIGADTDVNVNGESITWQAWRNSEPTRS